jgi:hypothetical protein
VSPRPRLVFPGRQSRQNRDGYGLRYAPRVYVKIRLHALWHTTASLLKDLGVPPRDAQIILGHAQITTTQQIYNHVDEAARLDAITKISRLRGPIEPALWPGMVDSGPLCAAGQNVLPGGGEGARTPDPCLQIAVIGRLTGR